MTTFQKIAARQKAETKAECLKIALDGLNTAHLALVGTDLFRVELARMIDALHAEYVAADRAIPALDGPEERDAYAAWCERGEREGAIERACL